MHAERASGGFAETAEEMRGQVSRRQTSPLRSPVAGCHAGTLHGGAEEDTAPPSLQSPGQGRSLRARGWSPGEGPAHARSAQAYLCNRGQILGRFATSKRAIQGRLLPPQCAPSPYLVPTCSHGPRKKRPPSAAPPALSRPLAAASPPSTDESACSGHCARTWPRC